jgi:RsiW-degrading membrane proteinase PrsW (M82 family)
MAQNMTYFLYLLGFLPSIIWLLFYLRKDVHPESNQAILRIFFYGMLVAFAAIFLEIGFKKISSSLLLYIFIGGALIEESLKYLVVKFKVLRSSELDEPVDIMLYMIIAGLGFAALENILILINYHPFLELPKTLEIITLRFLTATFLHALCSGVVGYFLAISFFNIKNQKKLLLTGLGIAIILHGLYNLSIIKIDGWEKFILPIIILVGTALFVSIGFKKLKRLKSICIIK